MFYTNANMLGNNIYVRGFDDDGRPTQSKIQFQPSLWVPNQDNTESIFKSVTGDPLKLKEFSSIRDARDYFKNYKDMQSIFGSVKFESTFIHEFFKDREAKPELIRIANVDIEVYAPEGFPEPELAEWPVNAICHYDNIDDKYYTYHLINKKNEALWSPHNSELDEEILKRVSYQYFETEEDLLKAFISRFGELEPHVFTGWNSNGFDIPYLVNRIKKLLGDPWVKRLSPWKIVREKSVKANFGKSRQEYDILGVSNLDYMDVYKKQTFTNREFWTLDHISQVELGERKLSYDEAQSLHKLYDMNPQKFIDYNIKDVVLVKKLEEKLNLLQLVMDVAYFAGINFVDVASPIRTWESLIYNYIVPQGIIPPVSSGTYHSEPYPGGHVAVPQMGMFKWICSFDLTSLYPSIIRQWNISPDMLYETHTRANISELMLKEEIEFHDLVDNGTCIAGNGVTFKTHKQGFLSYLMESLFNERKSAKEKSFLAKKELKKVRTKIEEAKSHQNPTSVLEEEATRLSVEAGQWYTRQWSLKVLLNSAYGALASPFFCFYNINLAEAVTLSGQVVIKLSKDAVNKYLNKILKTDKDYCIYIDTDSNYFNLEPIVKLCMPNETDPTKITNFLDGVCKSIERDCLKPAYMRLMRYTNCREQVMNMDREVIASSGFWTGKKRYALKVYDNEGERYSEPKLKIIGLEIVKKDTPQIIRDELEKLVGIILNTHDNQIFKEEIASFKNDWLDEQKYSYDEIAQVKSVNGISKYMDNLVLCKKGTPKNSRAAIIYNSLIDKHGLNRPHIKEGEKVKMLPLMMPNNIGQPVVGYIGSLPKEFGVEKYVDFKSSYEKSFEKPLRGIAESIGWQIEETAGFDLFF